LSRFDGQWRNHPRQGIDLGNEADDLASGDLDLFGAASLFQLISEAVTRQGEAQLAHWLRAGYASSATEIQARQEAVKELTPRWDLRQSLSVETQLATGVGADGTSVCAWAEQASPLEGLRWTRWTPYVLPPLTLVLYALGRMELVHRGIYLLPLLAQMAVAGLTYRVFQQIYAQLSSGEQSFARLELTFALLESETFSAPYLVDRVSGFRTLAGTSVSQLLRKLGRLVAFVEVRQSGLLHGALQLFTLWDVHFFFRLDDWQRRHGAGVRGWLQALADFEALSSLAALAHARPEYAYPTVGEISDSGPRFEAKALGHPLLDAPIPNDVSLAQPGSALIITGSNMSGKSTLLRAMGVNTALALAGAPVCASAFTLVPLRTLTSMRIKDSLERGVSYFYAEVQRIRDVLRAAEAAPRANLFLVDEMLLGTNARERQLASAQIFQLLLQTGGVGAVTTHDLTFTALAEGTQGRVRNVHFQDLMQDDQLRFDFRLREGVVQTTNALRLLRLSGIPISDAPT
jgi:hypothetical protein